jgi:hypothetical protein
MWSNMEPEVVIGICEAVKRVYQHRKEVRDCLGQGAAV